MNLNLKAVSCQLDNVKAWPSAVRSADRVAELENLSQSIFPFRGDSFDPRKLLSSALIPYAYLATEKGLQFEVTHSQCVPQWVRGDGISIERLVSELVANAVEYTMKGSIWVLLHSRQKGVIDITVADTGPGLPVAEQVKLYSSGDAFLHKDQETQNRRRKEQGLGLCLVNYYIEHLRGQILVNSQPNQGTMITCVLPLEAWEEVQPAVKRRIIIVAYRLVSPSPCLKSGLAAIPGSLLNSSGLFMSRSSSATTTPGVLSTLSHSGLWDLRHGQNLEVNSFIDTKKRAELASSARVGMSPRDFVPLKKDGVSHAGTWLVRRVSDRRLLPLRFGPSEPIHCLAVDPNTLKQVNASLVGQVTPREAVFPLNTGGQEEHKNIVNASIAQCEQLEDSSRERRSQEQSSGPLSAFVEPIAHSESASYQKAWSGVGGRPDHLNFDPRLDEKDQSQMMLGGLIVPQRYYESIVKHTHPLVRYFVRDPNLYDWKNCISPTELLQAADNSDPTVRWLISFIVDALFTKGELHLSDIEVQYFYIMQKIGGSLLTGNSFEDNSKLCRIQRLVEMEVASLCQGNKWDRYLLFTKKPFLFNRALVLYFSEAYSEVGSLFFLKKHKSYLCASRTLIEFKIHLNIAYVCESQCQKKIWEASQFSTKKLIDFLAFIEDTEGLQRVESHLLQKISNATPAPELVILLQYCGQVKEKRLFVH